MIASTGIGKDVELLHAVELCRSGQWERGLPLLGRLAERGDRMTGLAYSYLGYGVAVSERRVAEGVKLCRHAVRVEFYQPEAWLNLARAENLAGHRREAVAALQRGLALDGDHPELVQLRKTMGLRRNPVLPFLARGHLLNRILGRVRHVLRG
ncbi:MAG TPA: tetratricopeptide repeat protein [Thermoanaerobaculia bacterium]|nr:tetratricopeptide repeat protein [Thermoanaerobaculia bacterium]